MTVQIAGRSVGYVGYGLLGITGLSKPTSLPPRDQARAAMRAAITSGCTLWNGGEFYGTPSDNSLTLINDFFTSHPSEADKIILNIKGALGPGMVVNASPDALRQSVERCVQMLGGKAKIDVFECARRDRNVPIESELATLQGLVEEGLIGGIALSEVNAETIRKAAPLARILSVEVEISLFETGPLGNGITDACREFDIPILAYCPLGRGMLSGQIKCFDDLPEKDFRRMLPRFQPANFENNMRLVKRLEMLAQKKGCTSAQLAIAWIVNLSKREDMPTIIPIPGATTAERVMENAKAGEIDLSEEEMAEIDEVLKTCEVVGDRYHAAGMKSING